MKDTILLLAFAICFIRLFNSCSQKDYDESDILCRCFAFDLYNDDYNNCLIVITKDSMLTAYTGDRSHRLYDIIDGKIDVRSVRNPFLRKIEYKKARHITKDEFENLQQAIANVHKMAGKDLPKYYYAKDSWSCIIVTEDKKYAFDMFTDGQEAMRELVQVIDSLSPVRLYYRGSPICGRTVDSETK